MGRSSRANDITARSIPHLVPEFVDLLLQRDNAFNQAKHDTSQLRVFVPRHIDAGTSIVATSLLGTPVGHLILSWE
jgi:hypothetical protein